MSHGKGDSGNEEYVSVTGQADLHFQCYANGLVCPGCKSLEATFEIPIEGTATVDSYGEVDFDLSPESGMSTLVACSECGEENTLEVVTRNDRLMMCRDCHKTKDKTTFVHSVTGRYCCPSCAHDHDMNYFGQTLID